MANRKIEGDRLAEAIDAFRQRTSERVASPGAGAAEIVPDTIAGALAANAPAVEHRASAATIPSLRQAIAEFVTPRITHPGLLHGPRTTLVLEQLVSELLPALKGSDELRALASTVLEDEMGRHREVAARIHAGLAA
jgi:hypothetical protein